MNSQTQMPPPFPRTSTSKHFLRPSLVSPTLHVSRSCWSSGRTNGRMQTRPTASNKSLRAHDKRGPVSSIAGSALISKSKTWKTGPPPGMGASMCSMMKSTPKSSNAFGRGWCGTNQCKTRGDVDICLLENGQKIQEQLRILPLGCLLSGP